jgi:uncharacterized membrane protein
LHAIPLLAGAIDTETFVSALLRWGHIASGITWVGLLYFFNFVNGAVQAKLDAPAKKAVNPELMPRALWWFRWGAMSTIVFGLVVFYVKYMRQGLLRDATGEISDRAVWIILGMTLGLIMWFNVWFVIWPAQKTILRAGKAGETPPAQLAPRAKLFSRINTILSAPMLGCMVMPNNHPAFSWTAFAIMAVITLLLIHVALRAAKSVGATI